MGLVNQIFKFFLRKVGREETKKAASLCYDNVTAEACGIECEGGGR